MALIEEFMEILKKPRIGDVVAEMFVFLGPVMIAFFLGMMVGWAWKPRWASLGNCKFDISAPSSPSAFIASSMKDFSSILRMEASNSNNITVDKEQIDVPVTDTVENITTIFQSFKKNRHLLIFASVLVCEFVLVWFLLDDNEFVGRVKGLENLKTVVPSIPSQFEDCCPDML